ncbi:Xaa-Pro dipeptidase (X-Pro dipeptidase) (Imidodipeptidase) (Peptidase 4) (Peptidase D) (Proline dipeptidase) (Prolidase) [Durusdinium trenchii]|uniref:Xaa-Pro dipeptidase (X-Pro dipeptidase) (Imidodipeptidase) (Peptidase 4) (Peptidase D) (Proline dipeptidase) (Prolidase) n=1 Tax=Durusdinium trenchii TaxID=1381693 RepID=A0ABP0SCF1_9DINO
MAAKKQKLENGSAGRPPMVTGGTVSWERTGASFFSMGEGTLKVPMAMHAQHRKKLCQALAGRVSDQAIILLQGGEELSVYDTDTNWDFKQESNFQYLFGVKEPGCFAALRVRDAHALLFIPRMEKVYEAWCGPVKPPAWFQRAYEVEAAHVDEMSVVLEKMGVKELLVLRGETNRDSGLQLSEPSFEGKEKFSINKEGSQILWDQLNECRVVRTPVPDELDRPVTCTGRLAQAGASWPKEQPVQGGDDLPMV